MSLGVLANPELEHRLKHGACNVHNPNNEASDHIEVLVVAVERGLSVLGESVAQVIFHNLDRMYSLKRQDIIKKPDRFVQALQDLFGSGAAVIEELIIQSICAACGLTSNTPDTLALPSCIRKAEKALRMEDKRRKYLQT